MDNTEQIVFKNPKGESFTHQEVAKELFAYMNSDRDSYYKITIGTDSLLYSNLAADFVTAIVIHRVGSGGRYFYRRVLLEKFHTIRDRMLREVMISLDMGKMMVKELKKYKGKEFGLEIHVDIGEKGETKNMIQELTGMIRANNFEPIIKPYSYAATSVADKHT